MFTAFFGCLPVDTVEVLSLGLIPPPHFQVRETQQHAPMCQYAELEPSDSTRPEDVHNRIHGLATDSGMWGTGFD